MPYLCRVCVTAARVQLTDSEISTGVAGVVAVNVSIASAFVPGRGLRIVFFTFSAAISSSVRPVIFEPGIVPAGYPAGDRDGRPGIGL